VAHDLGLPVHAINLDQFASLLTEKN
jgi:hypothetical protein